MNSENSSRTKGAVRITFRGPAISEHDEEAGTYQQHTFPDLANASAWITMHIPQNEQRLVKMWIDDVAITGATLAAAMRPIAPDDDVSWQ